MLAWILLAAAIFGGMFLLDKGFTKLFRGKAQHKTGLSVRLPKRYGTAGIILGVLAAAVLITDFQEDQKVMILAGVLIGLLAAVLLIYYMSFGIYYDDDSFLLNTFGKKETLYRFSDIQAQKLYVTTGRSTIIELHMADGRAVSLQSTMEGAYAFLDKAFFGWCRQKALDPEQCPFHDPDNSCWFPPVED